MGHTSRRRVTWLRQEARRPDWWPEVHGAPTEQTGIERSDKLRLDESSRYICTLGIKISLHLSVFFYSWSCSVNISNQTLMSKRPDKKTCHLGNHHDNNETNIQEEPLFSILSEKYQVKWSFAKKLFWANLIFSIVMRCGIAEFGWRRGPFQPKIKKLSLVLRDLNSWGLVGPCCHRRKSRSHVAQEVKVQYGAASIGTMWRRESRSQCGTANRGPIGRRK